MPCFLVFFTGTANHTPTELLVSRIAASAGSMLMILAALNWIWNDASVVYDHEGISKATWLGTYGVKTLRWEDILHVQTHTYRGTASTTTSASMALAPASASVLPPTQTAKRSSTHWTDTSSTSRSHNVL